MKKGIIILISTLISLIVIFVCFELQSWYHFGDIPTTVVIVRFLITFIVVETINYFLLKYFTNRKSKK